MCLCRDTNMVYNIVDINFFTTKVNNFDMRSVIVLFRKIHSIFRDSQHIIMVNKVLLASYFMNNDAI